MRFAPDPFRTGPEAATPPGAARCFVAVADRSHGPVLAVGGGSTGLGPELAAAGRWAIDALLAPGTDWDDSAPVLNQAGAPVYGSVMVGAVAPPLDIAPATYGAAIWDAGSESVGPEALRELARVVRPGGLLVVGVDGAHHDLTRTLAAAVGELTAEGVVREQPGSAVPGGATRVLLVGRR